MPVYFELDRDQIDEIKKHCNRGINFQLYGKYNDIYKKHGLVYFYFDEEHINQLDRNSLIHIYFAFIMVLEYEDVD